MKIYQTGIIEAPKRFKGGYERNDYYYKGIELLDPERTSGFDDFKIGYVIMEKLYPSDELEARLNFLDHNIWFKFTNVKWIDDPSGGKTKSFGENDYSKETNDIIRKSTEGFGQFLLKTLFKEVNSKSFINDLRNFISNMETGVEFQLSTRLKKINRKEIFDDKFKKELLDIFDQLVEIAKGLIEIDVEWGDVHAEQFAYNAKGELTGYDIDYGMSTYDRDKKELIYPKPDHYMKGKKVKNVIREFSEFNK
jgi:hypothetical protein